MAAENKAVDIKLSAALPGEGLAIALVSYAGIVRQTMDEALLRRLDVVVVGVLEHVAAVLDGSRGS